MSQGKREGWSRQVPCLRNWCQQRNPPEGTCSLPRHTASHRRVQPQGYHTGRVQPQGCHTGGSGHYIYVSLCTLSRPEHAALPAPPRPVLRTCSGAASGGTASVGESIGLCSEDSSRVSSSSSVLAALIGLGDTLPETGGDTLPVSLTVTTTMELQTFENIINGLKVHYLNRRNIRPKRSH